MAMRFEAETSGLGAAVGEEVPGEPAPFSRGVGDAVAPEVGSVVVSTVGSPGVVDEHAAAASATRDSTAMSGLLIDGLVEIIQTVVRVGAGFGSRDWIAVST